MLLAIVAGRDGNGYWTRPGSVSVFTDPGPKNIDPSDPDPFKFHRFGSEKNTQTRTRESGGPVFFLFFIFFYFFIFLCQKYINIP